MPYLRTRRGVGILALLVVAVLVEDASAQRWGWGRRRACCNTSSCCYQYSCNHATYYGVPNHGCSYATNCGYGAYHSGYGGGYAYDVSGNGCGAGYVSAGMIVPTSVTTSTTVPVHPMTYDSGQPYTSDQPSNRDRDSQDGFGATNEPRRGDDSSSVENDEERRDRDRDEVRPN